MKKSVLNRHLFSLLTISIVFSAFIFGKIVIIQIQKKQSVPILDQIEDSLQELLDPILAKAAAMSEDPFLKKRLESDEDIILLSTYLESQAAEINLDGIDLASSRTEKVYQSAGTLTQMHPDDLRDQWYYQFVQAEEDDGIELYYDSLKGKLYLYYNKKIFDNDENILGVLGFLIPYSKISELLHQFSDHAILTAYIVNNTGEIIIHPDQSKIGNLKIYDYYGMLQNGRNLTKPKMINYFKQKFIQVHKVKDLDVFLIIDLNKPLLMIGKYTLFSLLLLYITVYLLCPFFIMKPAGSPEKSA